MQCVVCTKILKGRQTKYCGRTCKNRSTNTRHQNYEKQQIRGRERKLELIRQHGGKCQSCGYNSNSAALTFHHVDANLKQFQLDMRNLSNRRWLEILAESRGCILLCANCHAETHHPESTLQ